MQQLNVLRGGRHTGDAEEPAGARPSPAFAQGAGFYKVVWIFIIGSVAGYLIESVYTITVAGGWQNRQGLLYGPFIPVYGIGAVAFMLILYRLRERNAVLIFCVSALVGAAAEWACSFCQEKILGSTSWDYSGTALNLGGRTNLAYGICWGVLGLLFIRNMYPFLSKWIERIPIRFGVAATWLMVIFLSVDILLSCAAVYRQNERVRDIPPENHFEEFLDAHYDDDYMKTVFVHMRFKESAV